MNREWVATKEAEYAATAQWVDHKNRDKTDNRKHNLRCCERTENNRNRSKFSTNTSGVTGVFFDKERNRWVADITYNHKRIYIGRYVLKQDAIMARLEKIITLTTNQGGINMSIRLKRIFCGLLFFVLTLTLLSVGVGAIGTHDS